ncbi:peroxidasin [Trichonephila clavipes]|nr:peroxidasin [Trichonephila clavipes]
MLKRGVLVTNHLFEKPGDGFGMDLAAMNVQRAREHGVPGYNKYREYCGMPRARNFWDFIGILPNKTVHRYSQIYRHVDDIDLWSAAISEYPLPGAILGSTLSCLIAEQFANIRRGDRFWYENPGWPSSFTPEQLAEIRKVTIGRIVCDNSDDITTVPMNTFMLGDHMRYSSSSLNVSGPIVGVVDNDALLTKVHEGDVCCAVPTVFAKLCLLKPLLLHLHSIAIVWHGFVFST